jgi:hypothetical protein
VDQKMEQQGSGFSEDQNGKTFYWTLVKLCLGKNGFKT